jgi:hypothetical protein
MTDTAGQGAPAAETVAPTTSPRRARRVRRAPVPPVPRRWQAVVSVVLVVVVVSLVSWAFPAPAAPPAPGSADGVPVPPAGAYSSSALCAAGTGNAAATSIFLTNSTTRTVRGVMTSVGPAHGGAPVLRTVAGPGLGSTAVNPSSGLPQGSSASSFAFAGGGVVADQVVSGPGGWSTAPCASQTSSQWAFAGGSTTAGRSLTLALFDPAAPEAVVNVSFVTPGGLVTPQAYQGLVVPPGQLLVENVGDFVQNAPDIATEVTAPSSSRQAGGCPSAWARRHCRPCGDLPRPPPGPVPPSTSTWPTSAPLR